MGLFSVFFKRLQYVPNPSSMLFSNANIGFHFDIAKLLAQFFFGNNN